MPGFDPSAYPTLVDLGDRLRELAGDASYKAGRDYFKKGLVTTGSVAGATAYAVVTGSTGYRVSLSFGDEAKASCTCPAHRRNKFCKHVVALGFALLEKPDAFTLAEPAPETPKPARARRERAPEARPAEARDAGLETVDQLLAALAADGLVGLGPDKLALFATAGELVRARKLRRLGNRVLALQRAAEARPGDALDPAGFARLLVDLHFTRQATGAHLDGRIQLDARLGEDLLGKAWREADLEPLGSLELIELAATTVDDGEFRIESGYLADLASGTIYVERQIAPRGLGTAPRARHRCRLVVDDARVYPGDPPRRIRLARARRAPLTAGDVDRLVVTALDAVPDLCERLVAHLAEPFAPPDLAVLFRPAALVVHAEQVAALDRAGRFVRVDCPASWLEDLPSLLPASERYALFGRLDLDAGDLVLRCRSVVGNLAWGRGPIYPDAEERRR